MVKANDVIIGFKGISIRILGSTIRVISEDKQRKMLVGYSNTLGLWLCWIDSGCDRTIDVMPRNVGEIDSWLSGIMHHDDFMDIIHCYNLLDGEVMP